LAHAKRADDQARTAGLCHHDAHYLGVSALGRNQIWIRAE
jgi:hypothetical protein